MTDESTDPTADVSPPDRPATDVLYETGPSLRPAVVKPALALVVGVLVEAYVLTHPRLFGSRQYTEIGAYVVGLVVLVLLVRYAVRVYLLKRYRYTITDDAVRWEYSLFYKTRSRELPFSKIRGHEFRQDRIQSVLGFGSVSFLSGGTNRSLGFLTFENVADPEEVQSVVKSRLDP
ncbi:PH domain-containing protein [Haloplanus sp. GCM10025708]|uniref:PH domain-containing protein n=1 Tax=Haloplanus sp. GCM10025708 TaxID=3252679 RepID=UPI0036113CEB